MITQVFHDKKTLGLASNGPFNLVPMRRMGTRLNAHGSIIV